MSAMMLWRKTSRLILPRQHRWMNRQPIALRFPQPRQRRSQPPPEPILLLKTASRRWQHRPKHRNHCPPQHRLLPHRQKAKAGGKDFLSGLDFVKMNLRRKQPSDSLYLLLDTLCNAFGGIILLAVLVVLLTSKEKSQSATSSDSQEMLQRRLALSQTNLQQSLQLAASLNAKANDPRW